MIERAGSKRAAALALDVDRHMIDAWLGDGFAVPTGENEVAVAVRAERDRLVRAALRRAGSLIKRAAADLGVSTQTMKRWMLEVGMYHPTPALVRSAAAKKRHDRPGLFPEKGRVRPHDAFALFTEALRLSSMTSDVARQIIPRMLTLAERRRPVQNEVVREVLLTAADMTQAEKDAALGRAFDAINDDDELDEDARVVLRIRVMDSLGFARE